MNMRMVARSDAEVLNRLQHLFQRFNRQFFGSALAPYEIQVDLLIAA